MDSSKRKWLISIICLIVILFASENQSFACDPTCPDCQIWDPEAGTSGECVDDDDQDTTGGEPYPQGADDVCGYCQKCSNGACVNDDSGGNTDDICMVGPGAECDSCQSGTSPVGSVVILATHV